MDIKPRRSSHRTQWASQFAVASELCKRGFEVAFTMGNHPHVDIMVRSPNGVPFEVDVKGLYKKNFWLVTAKQINPNLFYIFALVPDEKPNRFFILTQDEVNGERCHELEKAKANAAAKGTSIIEGTFSGVSFAGAEKYENAWEKLPQ